MKQIIGIVLLGAMLIGILSLSNGVAAQEGPTPTPNNIDPVLREGMEIAELRLQNIRQLENTTPVNRTFAQRETLLNNSIATMRDTYTIETASDDMLFYDVFGFVPRNFNLHENTQNMMQSSIASYYDYQQDTLMLIFGGSNILEPLESVRYGYIYLQQLLNDNYDIFAARDAAIENGNIDQAMAINAIVEGDTQHTLQFYVRELIDTGELDISTLISTIGVPGKAIPIGTPQVLIDELAFPTTAGVPFVQELYEQTDSWRLVDLVYDRLPLSTEQILHPNLYLLYEAPHAIRLEPLADFWAEQPPINGNWELIRDQTLGEFYLRQHLALVYNPEVVDDVASGWGGDRFLLYSDDSSDVAMVWRTSWDTNEDFFEFEGRYANFISAWLGTEAQQYPDGTNCWMAGERSICTATLPGHDLLIVQAPTLDLTLNILLFELDHLATTKIIG